MFIFLPKPHYLKRKVCNPLGIQVTSFQQYSNFSFQVFKENVFIFLAQANFKRKVCYLLGISHFIQPFVKENVCIFLPIKYFKRKVCNPLGKSHYTNHMLKKMGTFSWPSHQSHGNSTLHQPSVKENVYIFLPIKYIKRKVCNPLGQSNHIA